MTLIYSAREFQPAFRMSRGTPHGSGRLLESGQILYIRLATLTSVKRRLPVTNNKKSTLKSSAKKRSPTAGGTGDGDRKRKRRVQQRSIDTRLAILKAALSEFADNGFDAASIRNIAERTGLQHPLITYHFRTKEILWRAVAEHIFTQIKALWDERAPPHSHMSPIDRIRAEYRAHLRFTMEYPDFHHFMLRESRPGNPRLAWLVKNFLAPLSNRVLRQIRASQKTGQLPKARPILIHYMFIGMASVLSSLGAEIRKISGILPDDPGIVEEYWSLIEAAFFDRLSDR
jgi:AcrR family transcriptional regulator